jgi:hypothetical protein
MSPPYTTPSSQNPPKALKKQDAIVDEPSTNSKTVVEKCCGTLNIYKTEKPLVDLVVAGMIVKEFWQHGEKDYIKFEHGKSLIPKHVHLKFSWAMQKIHERYDLAYLYGLNFIEFKIPVDILNIIDFDLHVELVGLHTIFHLKMLDVTMMSIQCMQVLLIFSHFMCFEQYSKKSNDPVFMCSLNHTIHEKRDLGM